MNATAPTSSNPPATEPAEPQTSLRPVPVWLLILLLLLLYWGFVYFDLYGGWFQAAVYAPYRSVQEVTFYQPPHEGAYPPEGPALFKQNCAICHQENGSGNSLNGCPPLDGSDWLAAAGPGRIIRITSKGLTGPVEVKGQVWNSGNTMLPIGDQLAGDEKAKAETLAAIISYIRYTFGNKASGVKADQVAAVRAKIKDRTTPFTAEELKRTPDTE